MIGVLAARLPDARLDQVADPRGERGQRWKLATLLRAILVAMVAGCKSLAQVEALTAEMALAVRRRLAIARRIADTTLRDALCTLDPTEVRRVLHALVRAAYRRKALAPDKLPFGVVALDGTSTVLPSCDDAIAQRQTQGEGGRLCGVLRTLTCTLISSPAMPCIDALPIPASTNEMGYFETALRSLVATYGGLDLFRMVTYDAGACSEHNGRVACALGVHYLFGLKGTQPTLFAEAQRLLAPLSPTSVAAFSTDAVSGHQVVRRLYLTEQMSRLWRRAAPLHRAACRGREARCAGPTPRPRGPLLRVQLARFASVPEAVAAARAAALGHREQLPPHPRYRLRGGRPTLDQERAPRRPRRRAPAPRRR
jgi:hypothetical protein